MSHPIDNESRLMGAYKLLKVRLALFQVDSADPDDIIDWLSHHFDMAPHHASSQQTVSRVSWVLLQLDLAVYLLQAAEIPIFMPAKIDAIIADQSDSGGELHVRFPWPEGIPAKALSIALQAGQMLPQRISLALRSQLSTAEIYAWINRHVIHKIRPYAPPVKSTIHLLRCAFENNIPFFHYGRGLFLLGTGSRSRLISGSSSDRDSMISARAAQDKRLTHQILMAAGLPVPAQQFVDAGPREVVQASRQLTWPLVAKPVNRDRGEGVTTNITTEQELVEAADQVFRLTASQQVILEEMQAGRCHRLVIVNRQLVYAVIRLPVAVVADGFSSIEDLITRAHQSDLERPPWLRSGNQYRCDSLTESVLAAAGFNFSSVPPAGAIIDLRPIESTEWGGRDEDLTAVVHPDNVALAVAAADALRLSIAGVDIMSTDLKIPWWQNKATINEVNVSPLIGGGPTSRRYLLRFLHCLMGTNPNIPIERLDQRHFSLEHARSLQEEKRRQGVRAFILSPDGCFDDEGRRMHSTFSRRDDQLRALLTNAHVDHLILIE